MSYPKIKPCPTCKTSDNVAVWTYELPGTFTLGNRYVECVKCDYRGPGEGSILAAIRSHNARVAAQSSDHGKDAAK